MRTITGLSFALDDFFARKEIRFRRRCGCSGFAVRRLCGGLRREISSGYFGGQVAPVSGASGMAVSYRCVSSLSKPVSSGVQRVSSMASRWSLSVLPLFKAPLLGPPPYCSEGRLMLSSGVVSLFFLAALCCGGSRLQSLVADVARLVLRLRVGARQWMQSRFLGRFSVRVAGPSQINTWFVDAGAWPLVWLLIMMVDALDVYRELFLVGPYL
ncbi:hypothetical protein F2Q70_00016130 [Brassica cretica]|uniref:Uncharacterized protein n=1 Tax=Brassica cretica TaxID=69181 RepID=A0A8S9HS35_BRACR|nr:hypothetical protein F2Q70_00016130 [Brassica cretica]